MAAGDLDASFSGDGRAVIGPDGTTSADVVVQPDGKVVVLGREPGPAGNHDLLLMRLLPDGTPDATFGPAGAGGRVRVDLNGLDDYAGAIGRTPDGRLVVAASAAAANGAGPAAVLRFLENGAPDPSFGAGGKVLLSPRSANFANALAFQADGKIVVAGGAGTYSPSANIDSLLVRLLPDGSPDTAFGTGGYVIQDTGAADALRGVDVDGAGRIVTAGVNENRVPATDLTVYRFTPGGSPDAAFGTAGRVTFPWSTVGVGDVLALPGDAVLVSHAAFVQSLPRPVHGLIRLTASGEPDASFGTGGFSNTDMPTIGGGINQLALQHDGKIVVGGPSHLADRTPRFFAARFGTSGRLDTGFSGDGVTTALLDPARPNTSSYAGGVAVGPDGHVVLAGYGDAPYRAVVMKFVSGPPTPPPVVLKPDGTLHVGGTFSGDAIDLEWLLAPGDDFVRVRMNGANYDFAQQLVQRVSVDAGDGADRVAVAPEFLKPVHVAGGAAGGGAPDAHDAVTLNGTADSDSAIGGPDGVNIGGRVVTLDGVETVWLNLSGGNDNVDVQPEATVTAFVIDAGEGNDSISLRAPVSFNITGGQGTDVLRLRDGGFGRFDGGEGADTATFDGTAGDDTIYVQSHADDGAEPSDPHSGTVWEEESASRDGAELDFQKVESVHVSAREGWDNVSVDVRLGVTVSVDGGPDSGFLSAYDWSVGTQPHRYAVTGTSITRNGAPRGVTMSQIQTVMLQTAGPSHVTVTPSQTVRLAVDADADHLPESTGDRLDLDLRGVTGTRMIRGERNGGIFNFGNRQPVEFYRFEHIETVVGRHVFYNRSAYDGGDPAPAAADDAAVAPDKVARRAGEPAHFRQITSYSRGMNGIMIDLIGLPDGAELGADDFAFRSGTTSDPAAWAAAPSPARVAVRRGAGAAGSDRVTITWADGAIRNAWLEVTVKPTTDTGLTSPDVFYFGNLVGETGDAGTAGAVAAVTARDLLLTRRKLFSLAPIDAKADFDRDGRVGIADWLAVRSAPGRFLPPIVDPAASPPAAASSFTAGRATVGELRRRGAYDLLR